MGTTTEEAVLLAFETREELFGTLYEMLSSDNYVRVLMRLEKSASQSEIADAVGIGQSTVSRAIDELVEFGLVKKTEEGYVKSLPVLDHPMIQYYYRNEVVDNV